MTSTDAFGLVAGGLLAAGAGVVAVIARLGLAERLPRQHWAGIRLPSTMRSDEAWRVAHVAGGRAMLIGALIALALGVVVALWRPSRSEASALVLAGAAALLAGVLVGAVKGTLAARLTRPHDGS